MRRLTGEDNSFLAWENAAQPQHTIKVMVLDPSRGQRPLTFEAVKALVPGLVDRVEPLQWQLLMPRFRLGRPWWVARPRIDVDHHVRRITLTTPGGDHELALAIDAIFHDRLDRSRPAWQLFYVDGLADGRIALIWKIHHAVADGTASLRILEALCGTDTPPPTPPRDERRPAPWQWLPMVARHQLAAVVG
ncbi:MAG: wax ester/triacylglycerol synthase domain-containing protein, partial [Mycobacterium sp.]